MRSKNYKRRIRVCFTLIVIAMVLVLGMVGYIIWDMNHSNGVSAKHVSEKRNEVSVSRAKNTLLERFETLGIRTKKYPLKFKLEKNLEGALVNLASINNQFSASNMDSKWDEVFIKNFLMSSRYSFDYLDEIAEKNAEQISKIQAEYMCFSLTGEDRKLNLSEKKLDRKQATSTLDSSEIKIKEYRAVEKDGEISLSLKYGRYKIESSKPFEIGTMDVKLKRNPYSCFDGYSVVSLLKRSETSGAENDSKSYYMRVVYSDEAKAYEVCSSPEELNVSMYVELDVVQNSDIDKFLKANKGKTIKVEFKANNSGGIIDKVKPISVYRDID